jgi:hypothetical protein
VAAECGGARLHRQRAGPSATILDDSAHARHSGSVHSGDIAASLTYLSVAAGLGLDSAGHAVVAR